MTKNIDETIPLHDLLKLKQLCFSGGSTYQTKVQCGVDNVEWMIEATKVVFEFMYESLDKCDALYRDN